MTITPRFLDELRSRLTLSEVVGRRVKLTRAGREFKGCCPFHKEKTPSFYVNDDKQFYHCFGCGAHGDVVGFTMRDGNLSFPEAVAGLAAQAGMQMPAQNPADIERAKTEKSLYGLMEASAAWFVDQLHDPRAVQVMDYLKKRGLSPESISGFRLGYAPGDDQALRKHLAGLGYSDDQMLILGLIKKSERAREPYAFFRDRVMFPVCDRGGRVVAFGGRILPDHMRPPDRGDFKPAKYMNSPETPLFHKGRTVYALSQARQAALSGHPLVVVEGYMDVIAAHQAGFTGAIAPLGTALTEEQIALLWRLMPGQDKVIHLCFDGDSAGQRAAIRAADRMLPLLKPDHTARIAFLPEGEDPDTLIQKKGPQAFTDIIAAGMPLAEFIWQTLMAGRPLNTPEDRAGFETAIQHDTAKITDEKVRFYYQKFFKDKLYQYFRPKFEPRVNRVKSGSFASFGPAIRPTQAPAAMQNRAYDILIATLLNHPNLFHQVDEEFGSLTVHDPVRDGLRLDLIEVLAGSDDLAPADLMAQLTDLSPERAEFAATLLSDQVYVHARFARPGTEPTEALTGWREVYDHIQKRRA